MHGQNHIKFIKARYNHTDAKVVSPFVSTEDSSSSFLWPTHSIYSIYY